MVMQDVSIVQRCYSKGYGLLVVVFVFSGVIEPIRTLPLNESLEDLNLDRLSLSLSLSVISNKSGIILRLVQSNRHCCGRLPESGPRLWLRVYREDVSPTKYFIVKFATATTTH